MLGLGIRRKIKRFLYALSDAYSEPPGISAQFYHHLIHRTDCFSHLTWHGCRVWQNPFDLWLMQEILFEQRPALVIETGTCFGGSALFYAQILDRLGKGSIVTVDVQRYPEGIPEHPRIEALLGGSTDPSVIGYVQERALSADGPVIVVLDSDHSAKHVFRELEIYAPLVSPGCSLVIQDTIIDQIDMYRDCRPGPLAAVEKFLRAHPEFEVDTARNEKLVISHCTGGWLKRRETSSESH